MSDDDRLIVSPKTFARIQAELDEPPRVIPELLAAIKRARISRDETGALVADDETVLDAARAIAEHRKGLMERLAE